MSRPPEAELVTVGWVYGAAEWALAMSMLEARGVTVLSHSREMASVFWHYAHALGGVALCVPAAQADLAMAVLADFQPGERRGRPWLHVALAVLAFLWGGVPLPPSGFFLRGALPVARAHDDVPH